MDNLNLKEIIEQSVKNHNKTFAYVNTIEFYEKFAKSVSMIYQTLKSGGCIMSCGNGGSFSDAQHFTAELVVRFERDRNPLSSITLGSNFSNLTACSNDYSYDEIFKREYKAISKDNDVLIAISTSGRSKNIINLINYAIEKKRKFIFLTSDKFEKNLKGGVVINFPFTTTAAVQESHIFTLQLICKSIDDLIIGRESS